LTVALLTLLAVPVASEAEEQRMHRAVTFVHETSAEEVPGYWTFEWSEEKRKTRLFLLVASNDERVLVEVSSEISLNPNRTVEAIRVHGADEWECRAEIGTPDAEAESFHSLAEELGPGDTVTTMFTCDGGLVRNASTVLEENQGRGLIRAFQGLLESNELVDRIPIALHPVLATVVDIVGPSETDDVVDAEYEASAWLAWNVAGVLKASRGALAPEVQQGRWHQRPGERAPGARSVDIAPLLAEELKKHAVP